MAAWLIISGSPYAQGTCSTVAKRMDRFLRDLDPQASIECISIASIDVHGCIGCDKCKEDYTCIYQDDQSRIINVLDAVDVVLIISPIYFAGVPSQFKAVLDRLQPYYWKRQEYLRTHDSLPKKRPFYLALVGEGGDPYGAEPAVASVASPFALADLELAGMHAFISETEERIYTKFAHQIAQAYKELIA